MWVRLSGYNPDTIIINGNAYRLIAAIHDNRWKVFIRHVLTHAEYDRETWKKD